LKEIFARKDKFLADHEELNRNSKKDENMQKQFNVQEEVKQKINVQLKDEINNFKNEKEGELLFILKKFIEIKHKATQEVS
jgi:hypothetical protein